MKEEYLPLQLLVMSTCSWWSTWEHKKSSPIEFAQLVNSESAMLILKKMLKKEEVYLQKLKKFHNSLSEGNHGISHRLRYRIICKASLNKKSMGFPPPDNWWN